MSENIKGKRVAKMFYLCQAKFVYEICGYVSSEFHQDGNRWAEIMGKNKKDVMIFVFHVVLDLT